MPDAEPVPPDLIRRANAFLQRGRAFRVYGASEAVMIGRGFVEAGTADLAAETDGRIVDFAVRVIAEDGRVLPAGREGEILARGPARFVGYVDRAETARSIDDEGYFHTGDLGIRTADHAFVITGRRKDLINRGGEKLSAREIEDVLAHHPAVLEVAAVAMPHPRLGWTRPHSDPRVYGADAIARCRPTKRETTIPRCSRATSSNLLV